jgi:hypothetical protein
MRNVVPSAWNPTKNEVNRPQSGCKAAAIIKLIKRRHPDSNWGIKDLQSSTLPLSYAAYSDIGS